MASSAAVVPQPEPQPYERWLVLVGALVIQAILGTLYGFSILVKPLQAQFPDWSNKEIQLAFNLALATFAAVMVPAGRLQDRRGPRLPALLGAAALFVAFLLAAQVRDTSQKWLWWLSYGVVGGAGIGLAYVCPIAALAKWFPEIKGLITGVAVAGFGGGAAIFAPQVVDFLNPAKGGRTLNEFFVVHAVVCGLLVAVGALLLKNPPAGWVPAKLRDVAKTGPAKPAAADLEWQQMLGTNLFWLLWVMFMGSAMAGLMTIGIAKTAVNSVPGITEDSAKFAVSVLAIFNAGGRIFWGGVSDRLGRLNTMTLMFAIQTLVMFLFNTGLGIGVAPAYVLIALVGLNFGGTLALFPAATADAFGTKNLGINYGWMFTAYGVGGIVGPQVAAYFKDVKQDFAPAYLTAGVFVLLATVLSLVYRAKAATKVDAEPLPA